MTDDTISMVKRLRAALVENCINLQESGMNAVWICNVCDQSITANRGGGDPAFIVHDPSCLIIEAERFLNDR